MTKRLAAVVLALSALSGCASIVSGVYQPIRVETRVDGAAMAGATCTLTSNKGTWFVTTPASLTVHRGFQDLAVDCTKVGLEASSTKVASHVRAIAFGNILFGGVIGVAVDSGDGAAFDYPDLFTIDMVESQQSKASVAAAPVTVVAPIAPVAPSAPVTQPGNPVPVAVANPYAAPSNLSEPKVVATKPMPAARDRSEHRYQLDAEQFAVDRTCASKPVQSIFTSRGPGYEVYDIPCKSGAVLVARCDFGKCQSVE